MAPAGGVRAVSAAASAVRPPPIALAGHSREDTDDFRNVFCLRYPIER